MILPREARVVLAKLQLCMHGSITSYNSSGGRDSEHPGGKRPVGEARPPHERWRRIMLDQPGAMAQHIRDAEAEWRQITGISAEPKASRPSPKVDLVELRRDVLKMYGTPREVVKALRGLVTEKQVIAWREAGDKHGKRDVSTGYLARDGEPWQERALRLKEQGCPPSQIAMSCGVSRQAVHQLFKRAA